MKTICVTGSSGFIGGHLTKRLRDEGNYVIGVDIVKPKYPELAPDEFHQYDLRDCVACSEVFVDGHIEEVYNLACLMGGMGYIGNKENEFDVIVGSSLIVTNVLNACVEYGVKKTFYSSSACVYNMSLQGELNAKPLHEKDAYPALPDLAYGWQKLFSEQMYDSAIHHGLEVRIARFHNVHGTHTVYDGGKEKAPAAICRKVSMAKDGDEIEIWGDGKQERSFMYIDDCIEGIRRLMKSKYHWPINLGSDEVISINDLTKMIIEISGKKLTIKNVEGIQGVRSRNSDNKICRMTLNWSPSTPLLIGLERTYDWIHKDIHGNS